MTRIKNQNVTSTQKYHFCPLSALLRDATFWLLKPLFHFAWFLSSPTSIILIALLSKKFCKLMKYMWEKREM